MDEDCILLSSDNSSPTHAPHACTEKFNFLASARIDPITNNRRATHFLSDSEHSDSGKSDTANYEENARSISPAVMPELDSGESNKYSKNLFDEEWDRNDDISSRGDIDNAKRTKPRSRLLLSKDERAALKEAEKREKAEKKAAQERLRQMKPGECIKTVKVVIDTNLQSLSIYEFIEKALTDCGADFITQIQPVPRSITWLRTGNVNIEDDNAVIMCDYDELLNIINNGRMEEEIQQIKSKLPNKKITFVFLLLSSDTMKNKNSKDVSKRRKHPPVNKKKLEMELVRLHLEHDCSYRMIDSRAEVGMLIAQFTKAISEIPYRREKERQEQEMAWLASADSRGSVRVDKSSNGLSQLWTQQLLQFNNCNLNTVKEIAKHYPTPRALVDAYNRCSTELEAETLLKDIPIVRGCIGDLAAKRKVGRELSKKLYLLFTCKDPNVRLSNE